MAGETYTIITDAEKDPESPITTSLVTRLRDNPIAMFQGASGAPKLGVGVMGSSPDYMYTGSGDDGAVTHSSNTSLNIGEYHFTNYTLNSGITLDTIETLGAFLVIRCTGTATITGTIDLSSVGGVQGLAAVDGASDGSPGGNGTFGGAGGGGGADDGNDGGAGGSCIARGLTLAGGAGGISAAAGSAGPGLSSSSRFDLALKYYASNYGCYGAGGGGGSGAGASQGGGGVGGGGVIIIAETIDFQSGASIDVSGNVGANSGTDGGGGGGGGGIILFVARTITDDGTTNVAGGAGGTGSGPSNGGAGGAGLFRKITVS